MKIIQVQTQAEAGGAQRVSDMVADGLRRFGHDVKTIFMYRKTDLYDSDPYAEFIKSTPPDGLFAQAKAAIGLIGYLRREKPDAVITYQYWGNMFGALGAKLAGTKLLIANQSGPAVHHGLVRFASYADKLFGRWGWYDHNIVNSYWTFQQFADYPPAYLNRLRRIDHGVSVAIPSCSRTEARQHFRLPLDAQLVISTGRLTPDKNQAVLLTALEQLAGVHVALAGAGPDYQRKMLETAQQKQIADRLHFVGELSNDEVAQFLQTGDVFAFPSRFESFGLSVVEAAIAGVPIVANDLDVLHEVLTARSGQSAALFAPSDDPDAFTARIAELLSDPALCSKLSDAGKSLADRYAVETMCKAYARLLEKN